MNLKKFYKEDFSKATSKLILKSKINYSDKALFLDRDGILIKDVHRINSVEKVQLCPNVINFLRAARKKGFDLFVITNQSSVSRSIISYDQYLNITSKFLSFLTEDLYPELILSSFHLPKNENNLDDFHWRKPGAGMIDFALKSKKYNKSLCIVIGDKLTDLMAGYHAGLNNFIYIKSELHKEESSLVKSWATKKKVNFNSYNELRADIL